MFQRKILSKLSSWLTSDSRKPLIIRGARQTGKTTAVRMLGQNIPGYMEINLEAPGEKSIFEKDLPVKELISALRLKRNISVPHEESLLFLDEIQASPKAISYLRFFYENIPELPVIASGSLLEAYIYKAGINFPVGRVEQLYIYPLTFSEYLEALNKQEMLSVLRKTPFPDYALSALYEEYTRYTLFGGMPEILQQLCRGKTIEELQSTYFSLLLSFQDDVSKYSSSSTMRQVITHCFSSIPNYTGERINFSGFGNSSYKSREIGEALRTLQRAMLIDLVYPTSSIEPPIKQNLKKHPKLFFLDSGLLAYALNAQSELFGSSDLNKHFKGIMAEQQTAQTLKATGNKLLFWTREANASNAEVDFVKQVGDKLIPIEVKSGSTGRLRSLHSFMERCPHNFAIRIYSGPARIDELKTTKGKAFQLMSIPHFVIEFIDEYINWFLHK